jgi:hypothetical protein
LDQAQAEERYCRSLLKLIDPERFPETAQLFASGTFQAPAEHLSDDPAADHRVRAGTHPRRHRVRFALRALSPQNP